MSIECKISPIKLLLCSDSKLWGCLGGEREGRKFVFTPVADIAEKLESSDRE
jgi:hypothetical protein